MQYQSALPQWPIANKRVFVRADLNVPIKNGIITNDFRLNAIVPTLLLIQEGGGMVILATHIGRPHGYEESLSTKHLIPPPVEQ